MPRMRLLGFCGAAVLALMFGIATVPAQDTIKDATQEAVKEAVQEAPPDASNDKKIELKLSHWVPPTHPLQKAIEDWGADVEKASGGSITYKVFPSQQLGKAFDHYDMARDGIADFIRQSGLSAGPFPDHRGGRVAVPDRRRPRRYPCDRRMVSQICGERDERREVLLLVHPRSADLAFQDQEDRGAGRHQGHEDPSVAGDHCGVGDTARRHQCAGQRDRGA